MTLATAALPYRRTTVPPYLAHSETRRLRLELLHVHPALRDLQFGVDLAEERGGPVHLLFRGEVKDASWGMCVCGHNMRGHVYGACVWGVDGIV